MKTAAERIAARLAGGIDWSVSMTPGAPEYEELMDELSVYSTYLGLQACAAIRCLIRERDEWREYGLSITTGQGMK